MHIEKNYSMSRALWKGFLCIQRTSQADTNRLFAAVTKFLYVQGPLKLRIHLDKINLKDPSLCNDRILSDLLHHRNALNLPLSEHCWIILLFVNNVFRVLTMLFVCFRGFSNCILFTRRQHFGLWNLKTFTDGSTLFLGRKNSGWDRLENGKIVIKLGLLENFTWTTMDLLSIKNTLGSDHDWFCWYPREKKFNKDEHWLIAESKSW